MVKLIGYKEFEVTKEQAEKILTDQENRAKSFKIAKRIELKDKDLTFENGVIVRRSKGKDKDKAE